MEVRKLYEAIDKKRLFHIVSKQTRSIKTYIKFRRHDSVFTFIYTPKKLEGEQVIAAKYVLLRGKEKARAGTVRAMWQDFKETGEGG